MVFLFLQIFFQILSNGVENVLNVFVRHAGDNELNVSVIRKLLQVIYKSIYIGRYKKLVNVQFRGFDYWVVDSEDYADTTPEDQEEIELSKIESSINNI